MSALQQQEAQEAVNTALKISEARTRAILRIMTDGVVHFDETGLIVSVNEAVSSIFGHTAEEMTGQNINLLIPESQAQTHKAYLLRYEHNREARALGDRLEINARHKTGLIFPIEIVITEMVDDSGSSFIGVIRDVTKQHADRQALRDSVIYSETLLNSVGEGIHGIDLDGKIIFENQVATTMFGWEEQEMLGQSAHALIHHTRTDGSPYPRHECHIYAALHGKSSVHIEDEVFWRKDGTSFPVSYHVTPMQNSAGNIIGALVSFRDITARQQIERNLNEAKNMAEQANQAKSSFLANMSHEIRTPINAVLGFSDLALRLDMPERLRDYLEKIHRAATIQLGVINDILDFSKIEANKLQLEALPFNLNQVLRDSYDLFKLAASAKGLELVVGAKPAVPELLIGDALRLSQVINNLLGNAIKFTASGEVSLIATVELLTKSSVSLCFVLQDSGIGMSEAEQSGLFQSFAQADSSTTRTHGGTGLGLVISRQLVELMGGQLTLKSQPDKGSCFTFTACFTQQKNKLAQLAPLSRRLKTLLIEDSAVARLLMTKQLSAFGCEVVAVDSGNAALSLIQQGAQFELVVLDCNLPDMQGVSVARHLRLAGHKMPVIAATGGDIEQLRTQAGDTIQDFLAKPITSSTLYNSINYLLAGSAATVPACDSRTVRAAPPQLAGYRILLVDDNEFNREVALELIGLTSAQVAFAVDGKQAVAAVFSQHYDLVLMDIQMPVMDGYEAARQIRLAKPDLPVIALTAHAMIEEKPRVLACGMQDILAKPIIPGELFAKLAQYLTGSKPAAPFELAYNELPDELQDELKPPPDFLPVYGFDYATALSRVNGDPALLLRFLRMFYERNATTLKDIEAALSDLPKARRLLHTLKGGAGTIGMIALQAAALDLELELSQSSDLLHVQSGFTTLQAEFDRTQQLLAEMLKQADQETAHQLLTESGAS